MKTIAFFNNKGGVGQTSLVYHLAWMYADQGQNVVAADLDPQADLTRMFVDDDRIERLWREEDRRTVYGALKPLLDGTGDIALPHLENPSPGLDLVAGDLKLAAVEDEMAGQWPDCLDRKPRAFRVLSALWRVLQMAAEKAEAGLILIDAGRNLGALNRAVLIAADYVVVPLAPDVYSSQGLRNLGPVLREWREQWSERFARNPVDDLDIPEGSMNPIGYVVMQDVIRFDRPVRAYARWFDRIPAVYSEAVLDRPTSEGLTIEEDPGCLAVLKYLRLLMPMAREARKPMFSLKPGDGAFGGHDKAVQDCYREFRKLADVIDRRSREETR